VLDFQSAADPVPRQLGDRHDDAHNRTAADDSDDDYSYNDHSDHEPATPDHNDHGAICGTEALSGI
jgi:hypothetical protein